MSVGILGIGAGVPRARVDVAEIAAAWDGSGRGSLAVCGPDEDSLTLAWGAGTAALEAAGLSPVAIGGMWWGTARLPMAEGPTFAFLAAALGLGPSLQGLTAGGSTHAGLDALQAAVDAIGSGALEHALVIASDALVPGLGTGAERSFGAGSVALVLGQGPAPATLAAVGRHLRPVLDRYRGLEQAGTGDPYDPRLYRERELIPAVAGAVAAVTPARPEGANDGLRWALPDPDGRLGAVVARALKAGEVVSQGIQPIIGDTGSAAPFLGALRGFASSGPLMMVGEGGGRSSAWLWEVAAPVPGSTEAWAEVEGGARETRMLSYGALLRARSQLVPLADPVAMGVPPGSAAFVRGNGETLGLLGRRCGSCGTIAVPPSIHPVCPSCGTSGGDTVTLARRGRVHTFVVNHTMPAPFEAPLPLCVVDLDDGARVMLQGLPEDGEALEVGDRVALELRRYALERGVPVYGFKVRRDK